MKIKRRLFLIFFCFTLVINNNIAQAAEGINAGLPRQPSVVLKETTGGGGAAEQPIQQAVPNEQQQPSEQQIPGEQTQVPPPPTTEPKLTETGKSLGQINEEEVQKKQFFSRIINILSYALIFLIILIIIAFLFIRLKSKLPAKPARKPTMQKQEQQVREEQKPSNISDAVASFVRHRLKK